MTHSKEPRVVDPFFCRMSELAEGDTRMLFPTHKVAQEAYIIGQRLAVVALGSNNGHRILDLSRGNGELPKEEERLKLGVFTVVSAEITRAYDLETARVFMHLADRYSGDVPVELIAAVDSENRRPTVLSLYDSVVDLVG